MKPIWFLLFLAPTVMVGVNIYVDPANLVQINYRFEKRIAELNLSGSNVIIPLSIADYDERIYNKMMLTGATIDFDVVTLGSSRIRQFYEDDFPSFSFHNFSMAAANLEDLVTFTFLLSQRKKFPRLLIVGLEHWMVDKDPGYTHWQSLRAEYDEALKWLGLNLKKQSSAHEQRVQKRWFELLNPAYFQASIRLLLSGKSLPTSRMFAIKATQQTFATADQWLQKADGSAGEMFPPRTNEDVDVLVKTKADGVSPLVEIDEFRVRLLNLWLNKLKTFNGTKICFFLAPVHPYTYTKWLKSNFRSNEAEHLYRKLAKDRDLCVIGSYNPDLIGAGASDFFDWVHPRRVLVRRLAAEVYHKLKNDQL